MNQPAILKSFANATSLVINKFLVLKKRLKSAKNSLNFDLRHFDKNDNVLKTKNVLNEVICVHRKRIIILFWAFPAGRAFHCNLFFGKKSSKKYFHFNR